MTAESTETSDTGESPEGPKRRAGAGSERWLFPITIAIALVILLVLVPVVVLRGGGNSTGAATAVAGDKTIDVTLADLSISPNKIDVAKGTHLFANVTNKGAIQHDFKLDGTKGTDLLSPGQTQKVDLGTIDKTTQAWCTVPGHKQAGMVMDINVTGGSAPAAQAAKPAGAGDSNDAKLDPNAKPPADFKPYDPNLAPAPGGKEHKLTMHAGETVLDVAPGVSQNMFTFDGKVPGPTLRGKVGDIFTVTLVNDGKVGHSIDFHASKVPWDRDMRTIQPGESLVYQFEAKFSGAWMYHCGTAPALHHIGNGMYGAIIIDPPDLAPVDYEFLFVQSDMYFGPQGQEGDYTKMQKDQWDAVAFNGYYQQYFTNPIQVDPGKRIRAWVVDDGPSENSAFHIVGTIFDTVYKEGQYLSKPGSATKGGSQVLDLQPAQGGFVEFDFTEAGLYPMVTHKFSNPGKGALGVFRAGNPEPHTGSH